MKKLSILSLIILFVFTACKKDKNETPSLQGKWTVENNVYKEYSGGSLSNTYTDPGAGTTMDFQNNGQMVITYPDKHTDVLSYTLQPNSKVNIDGDIFEIRSLTSSNVTLFLRQDYGLGNYDEVYMNLKR